MGTATIVVLLIGIFRNIMGYIITPEKEVVELVALLAWSVILYQAGDGLQILFANALRGISDVKYMAYMAFFCHFGLECVLLSHLMNVSPMILWHHTCAAPTSVTTVYTEERRPGVASFRVCGFGDTSHLYAGGESPAFSGRFCETYACDEERHD